MQASTTTLRALATGHASNADMHSIGRVLAKECASAAVIGFASFVVLSLISGVWSQSIGFGLVTGLRYATEVIQHRVCCTSNQSSIILQHTRKLNNGRTNRFLIPDMFQVYRCRPCPNGRTIRNRRAGYDWYFYLFGIGESIFGKMKWMPCFFG